MITPQTNRRSFLRRAACVPALGLPGGAAIAAATPHGQHEPLPVSTFSIVAFDERTGDLGVAVQSRFFGVGTVVPWARANVGAVATQSYANVRYGPAGLDLLAAGSAPEEALEQMTGPDEGRAKRQAAIVDASGRTAAHSGSECLPWFGDIEGRHFSVQGNLLTGEDVVTAMAAAFEKARKSEQDGLGHWLVASLAAGQEAGGDRRGQQSAALLVVRENGGYDRANDRFIDLRVEDYPLPIRELARLLDLHRRFYASAHEHPPRR
ncbi:MAG TPA: DUF1028 domain-containing protein [Verrucomicrobiales bacterium]|nr:DUF1028 domain-containing protein [Verrucomicrobiales bacterium]